MRDRKDTLVNKLLLFRLKLANIAPKKIKLANQKPIATKCKLENDTFYIRIVCTHSLPTLL